MSVRSRIPFQFTEPLKEFYMSRTVITCLLLAVCFITQASSRAQTGDSTNDHEILRKLKEGDWPRAYREQDTKLLDSILADEFQMVRANGEWSNKAKELEFIKHNKPSYDSFRFEITRLDVFENGTAIVAGTGHVAGTDAEGGYRMTYQSSNVLIKRGGAWKAIASHVSGIKREAAAATAGVFDHHVHIMSPRMIKYFKDAGIPFSKPDVDYSQLPAIKKRLGSDEFALVSMAYLYGNPEFGKVEDERALAMAENDFVVAARRDDKRIKAYCSFDPLKDFGPDEAKRCVTELKADGLKMHFNASQVYLTVPEHLTKVRAAFELAAANRVPILLHFDNLHRRFGKPDVDLLVDSILKDLGPVDLQIAHFGTSGGFSQRTRDFLDAFLTRLENDEFLKKHRIMFDLSAVALDKDSEGVRKLTDDEFVALATYIRKLGPSRILFATDYPLYSAEEYIAILRDRVKLTEAEIAVIANNRAFQAKQ